MRLVEKNIDNVKKLEKNGRVYSWFVVMKSGKVSDSRNFVNYVWKNGHMVTTADVEYPMEWLPKAVQSFINNHDAVRIDHWDDEQEYREYRIG